MTRKDISTIQRMLARIRGAAAVLDKDSLALDVITEALEAINAILDREILTEDEK